MASCATRSSSRPAGARNVNYEGIRCDTYEWRQYAGLNSEHDGWDRTVENDWRRIENGELNAYHSALYQDYFCANKMPQGRPSRSWRTSGFTAPR